MAKRKGFLSRRSTSIEQQTAGAMLFLQTSTQSAPNAEVKGPAPAPASSSYDVVLSVITVLLLFRYPLLSYG